MFTAELKCIFFGSENSFLKIFDRIDWPNGSDIWSLFSKFLPFSALFYSKELYWIFSSFVYNYRGWGYFFADSFNLKAWIKLSYSKTLCPIEFVWFYYQFWSEMKSLFFKESSFDLRLSNLREVMDPLSITLAISSWNPLILVARSVSSLHNLYLCWSSN